MFSSTTTTTTTTSTTTSTSTSTSTSTTTTTTSTTTTTTTITITPTGAKEDDDDDKEENEKDDSRAAGDADIAEADVLSDQGMVQKEAHARVKNMTKLMKKVKKTLPKRSKQMLDKPLKDLQSIKPKDRLDNVKDTLFQAAVAIKKAKKLTK